MSTTLKALQRLEEQRVHHGSQGPTKIKSVHLEPISAAGKRSGFDLKAWRLGPKWVTILLLAAGLTGLWYFFIYYRPDKTSPMVEPMPSHTALPVKMSAGDPPQRQQQTPPPDRSMAPAPSTPVGAITHGMGRTAKSISDVAPAPLATPVNTWYGDGLKVQAVVFGPDPGARLAVINGRTVYQGDAVEGFVVVAIEEDAVVVRQGRDLWRAKLGR